MVDNDQNKSENRSLLTRERRRLAAERSRKAGTVTAAEPETEFGIPPMTARRDLAHLERGQVGRTHGGAVLSGFAGHKDSFQRRLGEAVPVKQRLARAAVSLLDRAEAVFTGFSTTAYYAARRIFDEGMRVTLLTNCVPVMELFSSNRAPNMRLVGTGGFLRRLTLSFVGPHAVRTIGAHFAEKLFLSVKGITSDGCLTDPDPLEAEVKRAMGRARARTDLACQRQQVRATRLTRHLPRLRSLACAGGLCSPGAFGGPDQGRRGRD